MLAKMGYTLVPQAKQMLKHGKHFFSVRISSKLNSYSNPNIFITGAYFNATAAELISAEVPLEDAVKASGGGYLAALGVYHETHCIVRLLLLNMEQY